MAQTLRQIKNRIRSIENTEKVTSALEMISATKLNRMDDLLFSLRPYFVKLDTLLSRLTSDPVKKSGEFFRESPVNPKAAVCLFTSDSGLCGLYNHNIIRVVEEFISRYGKDKISLILVGKKGLSYFKHAGLPILEKYIDLNGRYAQNSASQITQTLKEVFLSGKVDEVYVAYTHFASALTQRPLVVKILGLEVSQTNVIEYILEPDLDKILAQLIPQYISTKIKMLILEAFVSEHAARTVAMKTATDNADELLRQLTLLRNKVRQANITREILEIISAAEALKG